MNKILAILLVLISGFSYSQNIPNGGFENWETEDHFALDEWITYGLAERTTDASSNDYALKLLNYKNSAGNILSSSLFNVDWQNGSVDKFPYDGDPLSMVFDTKHDLANGDTGYFFAGFYEKGRYIGQANLWVNGNSGDDYVSYSVPIIWYSTSRTPDSVFIGIQSDLKNDPKGEGFIIVDDFRFENIGERTVEINNYDFENWSNVGVKYPKGYMSIDLLAVREWGGFLPNPSVLRNTESFRGDNCLKISNFQNWGTDIGEGYCFTGDTITHGWTPAFSINQDYKFLQGYYKFDQQGNDTAEVSFNVFLLGNPLGEGTIKFGETKDEWTFFSVPVTYYLPLTPDAATLRLVSANDNQTSNLGTTLYLDDLEFTNELKNTVSSNREDDENITIYPVPFKDHINFTCDGGTYKITNLNGQIVANGIATKGKNKIILNHLPKGVYILTIEDNYRKWQQKIIK